MTSAPKDRIRIHGVFVRHMLSLNVQLAFEGFVVIGYG